MSDTSSLSSQPKTQRYPIPQLTEIYEKDRGTLARHFADLNKAQAKVPLRGWKRRLSQAFIAAKKGNEGALRQLTALYERIIVERLTR